MLKCKILKHSSENVRTTIVEGYTNSYPTLGDNFTMYGEPLDVSADFRKLTTNIITQIFNESNIYTFSTESGSVYEVEIELL